MDRESCNQRDINPDKYINKHSYIYPFHDRDRNAHGDADADRNESCHTDADADRNKFVHADSDSDRDEFGHADRDADVYKYHGYNSIIDKHGNSHSYTDADSDAVNSGDN